MEDGSNDHHQGRIVNFALLIRWIVNADGDSQIQIRSENQGIPPAEVVLSVEAWLEKLKTFLKEQRTAGLRFGKDPDAPSP